MASLPLLKSRRLHHCQASFAAFVAYHQAGIVAPVVIALLPSMRRHLCHCRNGNCYSCQDGVFAVIDARCLCPCLAGVFALITCCWACVVSLIVMALLLLMHRHLPLLQLQLLPSWQWRRSFPWCADIITLVTQASLPSLCLCCAVNLQASLPLLSWCVLSRGWHGSSCRRQQWYFHWGQWKGFN
jgi:hypothetical protein